MLQVPSIEQIYFNGDSRLRPLAELYAQVFSEPPYGEKYVVDEIIRDVVDQHLPKRDGVGLTQCVLTGRVGDNTIGFGMCHGAMLNVEPSIRSFLIEQEELFPLPLDRAVFMSELGVVPEYRGCQIGKLFILERFVWAWQRGYVHYIMRTADEGSRSSQFYNDLGATLLPELQKVEKAVAGNADTDSKYRMYLYGNIPDNIEELLVEHRRTVERRIDERNEATKPPAVTA